MPPDTENESVPIKSAAPSLSAAMSSSVPSWSGVARTERPARPTAVTSAPIPSVTPVGIFASLSQSIDPADASASRVRVTFVSVPRDGSN